MNDGALVSNLGILVCIWGIHVGDRFGWGKQGIQIWTG